MYLSTCFTFQGSETDNFNSQYFTKFIPEDEIVSVIAPTSPIDIILPAYYHIQTLDFALKKRLRKCDPSIDRMTPCVMKVYEKLYGHEFNQIVNKYINLSDAIFSGIDKLESITGCLEPCNKVEYHVTDYITYHNSIARDVSTKILSEIGRGSISKGSMGSMKPINS